MEIQVIASGSSGNCYRLDDGQTAVLLECGIPLKRMVRTLGRRLTGLKGVLVTHEHGDHAKSAQALARLGLDIYASAGTFSALGLRGYRYKTVTAGHGFTLGSLDIFPFGVRHDAAEPLGWVLTSRATGERVLFFTDTYYVEYVFPGVDIIMGECNYSRQTLRPDLPPARKRRLLESHMSLEHLLELLEHYKDVKKIYLLHLSEDNSDEAMFRARVQEATGAQVTVC